MPRRHQEYTLSLDASELAWSGALDNAAGLDGWPWKDLEEWSADMFERGHAAEVLRVASARAIPLRADRVGLVLAFDVVDSLVAGRVVLRWSQEFLLVGVPCHFGGARWWFECPAVDCGARRAKLYRPGVSWWVCRECHGLTYTSRARYSARTSRSDGHGWFGQFLDRDETRHQRQDRANQRRRLSRWRADAREDQRREAWPVQVTCTARHP